MIENLIRLANAASEGNRNVTAWEQKDKAA